jgi:DNA-binding XRE family transcriptional regulator
MKQQIPSEHSQNRNSSQKFNANVRASRTDPCIRFARLDACDLHLLNLPPFPPRSPFWSLRQAQQLSQAELARRSGMSASYLSRLERGKAKPKLSKIRRIVEGGLGRHLDISIK